MWLDWEGVWCVCSVNLVSVGNYGFVLRGSWGLCVGSIWWGSKGGFDDDIVVDGWMVGLCFVGCMSVLIVR